MKKEYTASLKKAIKEAKNKAKESLREVETSNLFKIIPVKPIGINETYCEIIKYKFDKKTGKMQPYADRILTKKGKLFKVDSKKFIPECLLKVSKYIEVQIKYGFANDMQDVDGPTKSCLDILASQFNFNDNIVKKYSVEKEIVSKGKEYWSFKIINLGS
jgi:hypothetical protein